MAWPITCAEQARAVLKQSTGHDATVARLLAVLDDPVRGLAH